MRNPRNTGFAAACNKGAAGSDADHLLFLNPDTRLLPDTLVTVIAFMDQPAAERIGICGVQVVDDAGAPTISCARFPTLRIFAAKTTGLDRLAPDRFPGHHLRPAELTASRVVDQVIGAFFLVRRELFDRLGGFDERYFLYFEEVDFALRARCAGALSYFLKEAQVVHAANVSSDQVRDLRLYHSLRSRRLYAAQHWSQAAARALVAFTLTVELAARLADTARRRSASDLADVAAGYRRFAGDLLGRAARRSVETSR
jgi:GT2 family glycosyltransferase